MKSKKVRRAAAMLVCAAMIFTLSGCMSNDVSTSIMKVKQYKDGLIGDVTLYPDSETDGPRPCGINSIRFEFERVAVKPASGKVTVYRYDDDSVFDTISASDTKNVFTYTNPETYGAAIDFVLDRMLDPGEKYYVTADEGLFTVEEREEITSPAYGGKDVWNIQMANYGIVGTEGETKKPGDKRTFSLLLGDNVTSVEVETDGDAVLELSNTEFKESGDLTLTVVGTGYEIVTIKFLDDSGELVEKLENAVYIVDESEE